MTKLLHARVSASLAALAALSLAACVAAADPEAQGTYNDEALDEDAGVPDEDGSGLLKSLAQADIPAACARRGGLTLTGMPGGSVCLFRDVSKAACVAPGVYWAGDICLSPRLGRNPDMLYRPYSFKQAAVECKKLGAKSTGVGIHHYRCETPDQTLADCRRSGGKFIELYGPVVAGGPNVTVYKCELTLEYNWRHTSATPRVPNR